MKQVLPLILLSFLAFHCTGQTKKNTAESNVTWNKMTHDFGEVTNEASVKFDFIFTNIANRPISIDNVRTTCGCAAPDWSYDPVLPSSDGAVEITFTPTSTGVFEKKIKVFLNKQRKPEILTIKGDFKSIRESSEE